MKPYLPEFRLAFVVLLPALFSLVEAAPSRAAERNVIFIITDDESPTLGCYGDPVAVTPAIDAVAADGMISMHGLCMMAMLARQLFRFPPPSGSSAPTCWGWLG